jgi:tetratricopeptide (TPR) repeat protein
MWCGTCHDPHNEPVDPVSYYRTRCLGCHADTRFASDHPSKSSDCVGCHMPKKATNDGGHTVFTDHRIQRTTEDKPAAEPVGIAPWREPPTEFAVRNLGIALVETGMEERSWSQIVSGYRTLTEVQQQFPQDSEMFKAIGNALFVGQKYEEAAAAFELAVHFDPTSSVKESSLGSAYAALGKNELAELHLERALALDPLNLSATELLINLYDKDGEAAKAEMLKRKIASLVH